MVEYKIMILPNTFLHPLTISILSFILYFFLQIQKSYFHNGYIILKNELLNSW